MLVDILGKFGQNLLQSTAGNKPLEISSPLRSIFSCIQLLQAFLKKKRKKKCYVTLRKSYSIRPEGVKQN